MQGQYTPLPMETKYGDDDTVSGASIGSSTLLQTRTPKFLDQLKLLMWKRKLELFSNKTEILKTFLPSLLMFLLLVLFKETLNLELVEEYLVFYCFLLFIFFFFHI